MSTLFGENDPFAPPRFYAWLLALFAAIALVTAAVGLYGRLSYSATRRSRETGLRIALGAAPSRIR